MVLTKQEGIGAWFWRDTNSSWLWLLVRLYLGYEWLMAGWAKVGAEAWTGSKAGTALAGFVTKALTKTSGAHPDVQSWYAWFLTHIVVPAPSFWSYLVAYGELLVGIALILGVVVGVAAFFGAFMNMNYMLAGTVSVNPQMLALSVLLMLAWRVAGYIGLDYLALSRTGLLRKPDNILQPQNVT